MLTSSLEPTVLDRSMPGKTALVDHAPDVDTALLGADVTGVTAPRDRHGLSWISAMFFQVSIILGLGVLGIPWALGTLGWGVGLTALLLSAGGGIYSGITISALVGIATKRGVPPKRYVDLAIVVLGERGRVGVMVAQYTFLGGAIVAVQLTAAHTVVQLASAAGSELCMVSANVLIVVAMLPVMQFQELKDVTWAAVLGVVTIVIPLTIYLAQIDASPNHGTTNAGVPASTTFIEFAAAMSTMAFAFQGQTIFPEIISEMHTPAEFPKAVVGGVAMMTSVYLIVGAVGYHLMGSDAEYFNKWDNDHNPTAAKTSAANTMLIVHVLTGYVINGNVMNHIICDRLFPHLPDGKQVSRGTWLRVTLVTLSGSFMLSNLIPSLGLLIAVIGATSGVVLTFLFPAAASIWGKGRDAASPVRGHKFVFGAAAVVLVAGTVSTMTNLVKGVAASKAPFTCS